MQQRLRSSIAAVARYLPNRLALVAAIAGAAASLALFALIDEHALEGEFAPFDRAVYGWLQGLLPSALTTFFATVTVLGNTGVLLAVVATGGLVLLIRARTLEAIVLLVTFAACALLVPVMKYAFGLQRPDASGRLLDVSGPAFPSGHAALALAAYALLAYLLGRDGSRAVRVSALVAALAVAVLVGISRLVLGVHWLSDVLAGYALATVAVSLAILVVENMRAPRLAPRAKVSSGP